MTRLSHRRPPCPASRLGSRSPADGPAFGELLTHWVAAGQQLLRAAGPTIGDGLTSQVEAGLQAVLLEDLSFAAAPTLFELFQDWPHRRRFSPTSTADYAAFTDAHLSVGSGAMLASAPTLGPILDAVVDRWWGRVSRLLDRLHSDRTLLDERFGLGATVVRLDPLFGGSIALTGTGGERVVYKDRPLGMDQAFAELLRWINARGRDLELHVPEVIDRGDYGWMSEVAHRPPQTDADRARYWRRTGMLVCLVHALGGGDLHAGNIHPLGQHPVILDAEVLLRPRRTGGLGATASALATGWLPTPTDVGLCGLACERFVRPSRWVDAGTDAVRPRPLIPFHHELQRKLAETLHPDGRAAAAGITDGFSHAYRQLLTDPLPLEIFEQARPRVLLRPTIQYVVAITNSIEPSVLAADERARVTAKTIAAPPEALKTATATAEAVRQAEESALDRLEVPRFAMAAAGGPLLADGRRLGSLPGEAPMARARRLLSQMSLSALDDQCRAIVASITSAAKSDAVPANVVATGRSIQRVPYHDNRTTLEFN